MFNFRLKPRNYDDDVDNNQEQIPRGSHESKKKSELNKILKYKFFSLSRSWNVPRGLFHFSGKQLSSPGAGGSSRAAMLRCRAIPATSAGTNPATHPRNALIMAPFNYTITESNCPFKWSDKKLSHILKLEDFRLNVQALEVNIVMYGYYLRLDH